MPEDNDRAGLVQMIFGGVLDRTSTLAEPGCDPPRASCGTHSGNLASIADRDALCLVQSLFLSKADAGVAPGWPLPREWDCC